MIFNKGGVSQARLQERLLSTSHRRRYSLSNKLEILTTVASLTERGELSQNQAAAILKVSPSNVSKWQKEQIKMQDSPKGNLMSIGKGRTGCLDDIEGELLLFVSEWRDRGMPVTRFAVTRKACQLILEKTPHARAKCISRFLAKHELVHRMATHTAQRPPGEVAEEARSWIEFAGPKCIGPT